MDHVGQKLSHLLLANSINCLLIKPTGTTPPILRGKDASDAVHFSGQCLNLLGNLPDL